MRQPLVGLFTLNATSLLCLTPVVTEYTWLHHQARRLQGHSVSYYNLHGLQYSSSLDVYIVVYLQFKIMIQVMTVNNELLHHI